jgi:hypothetical protein
VSVPTYILCTKALARGLWSYQSTYTLFLAQAWYTMYDFVKKSVTSMRHYVLLKKQPDNSNRLKNTVLLLLELSRKFFLLSSLQGCSRFLSKAVTVFFGLCLQPLNHLAEDYLAAMEDAVQNAPKK